MASKKHTLRYLKSLGVKEVSFYPDGGLEHVVFSVEDALEARVAATLDKMDSEYDNMTEEEKAERLLYGHSK